MDAASGSRSGGIVKESGERMKKKVVVVMDVLTKLDFTALKWALAHVVQPGDILTLLGALPWRAMLDKDISIWADVWAFNGKNLRVMKKDKDWMSGKYRCTREIMELCEKYGAKLQVQLAMGCPLQLILLDKIVGLRAQWVVFDKRLKRYRAYYQARIPCNLAMVMSDREAYILRTVSPFISNSSIDPLQSPMTCSLTPEIIIASPFFHWLTENQREHLNSYHNPSSTELDLTCYDIHEEVEEKGGMKEGEEEEEIYYRGSISFETPTTPIHLNSCKLVLFIYFSHK